MRDASSKGWTNLQTASVKGWANIQTLVNQGAGGYGTKSLTSGGTSGGGYGSVNGVSAMNSTATLKDDNWDWDGYEDVNDEEADDNEASNGKASLKGNDEDIGDSWAWGSDSEITKQPTLSKNGTSQNTRESLSSSRRKTKSPPKTEAAVAKNDGWEDLISWDNDGWGESSAWSNEEWQSSSAGKSKITAGGKGGNKDD